MWNGDILRERDATECRQRYPSHVLTENFNDLCQILDIVKSGDCEAARQVAMRHVQRFSEYMESTEKGWAADMARERSA